jgi:hypothetical protein
MFPRVLGIFETILRVLNINFSFFLILFKYLRFSICKNYKIWENSIIFVYIYFPLVEPVRDLVLFFARSPNRFSSRTACCSRQLSSAIPWSRAIVVVAMAICFAHACGMNAVATNSFRVASSRNAPRNCLAPPILSI